MKKTKEEVRDWLLENCTNEFGNIDLSDLDFGNFNGQILACGWKIKSDLFVSSHEVGGNLYQNSQKVKGELHQCDQHHCNTIYAHKIRREDNCYFERITNAIVITKRPIRIKEVTEKELMELGYILKKEEKGDL